MDCNERKARIIWQCRRGMLELDLILNRFVEKNYLHLTDEQLTVFEKLLHFSDPKLYACLIEHADPGDKEIMEIAALVRTSHHP